MTSIPGIGFQLNQSLIAFGSGGVTGVGLDRASRRCSSCRRAYGLHFSVVGEELGLLGALVVLGLFA
jgi:cell division protein FtsW